MCTAKALVAEIGQEVTPGHSRFGHSVKGISQLGGTRAKRLSCRKKRKRLLRLRLFGKGSPSNQRSAAKNQAFWETEFPMLDPEKGPNGRRLYREEDVQLILKIKRLLYDEGFTIAGARRHLREGSAVDEGTTIPPGHGAHQLLNRKLLLDMRDSLRAFLTLLEKR